ncbi:DUF2163 domain-containing protein [uncultured Cohaesibacter sp.]|uniref:DUF2163 domain-containing protein n=1 Tax=uncultured Cohaesibacter sp. TaxID=1002546 RepID=UPI00292F093E|nr:DUF2163 domain-containing protein [uncultured Cohaesibacter sp.]
MRTISTALAEHLASGVTTLATCWLLKRSDGQTFGFTDHDREIELEGIICEPASGLTGSEIRQSDGFASDDQDVSGILRSDRITEADLVSGRYDAATIETWRVNWQAPSQAVLLRSGYLGEISRDEQSFQAEIRSLSIDLEQEKGRVFQYRCDAILGDSRCGLDLDALGLTYSGSVSAIQSQTWIKLKLDTQPDDGRLAMGQLEMTSGNAKAMRFDILSHQRTGSSDLVELWLPIHPDITEGDGVKLYAGCDKSFKTCRKTFQNQLNFRGFPHMPGNDYLLSYPEIAELRDGSALFED